ncbi:MAG: hypothetical protein ACREX1_00415 [Advenella sp.]
MNQSDSDTASLAKIRREARLLFWSSCLTLCGTFLMIWSITAGLACLAITFVLWFMCYQKLGSLTKRASQQDLQFLQDSAVIRMKIEHMRDTRQHINSNSVISLTLSFIDAPHKQVTICAPLSALAIQVLSDSGFADVYYLERTGQARLVPIDQTSV